MATRPLLFLLVLAAASATSASTRIFPWFAEPLSNPAADHHHVRPPPDAVFPRGATRFSGYRGGCSEEAFKAYLAQVAI